MRAKPFFFCALYLYIAGRISVSIFFISRYGFYAHFSLCHNFVLPFGNGYSRRRFYNKAAKVALLFFCMCAHFRLMRETIRWYSGWIKFYDGHKKAPSSYNHISQFLETSQYNSKASMLWHSQPAILCAVCSAPCTAYNRREKRTVTIKMWSRQSLYIIQISNEDLKYHGVVTLRFLCSSWFYAMVFLCFYFFFTYSSFRSHFFSSYSICQVRYAILFI